MFKKIFFVLYILNNSCIWGSEPDLMKENVDLQKSVCILTIDGGGIRGILPAYILGHIEDDINHQLNKKEDKEKIRLAECFDLIAGTSTGGIIALGLTMPDERKSRPLYPATKLVELYKEHGQDIFPIQSTPQAFINQIPDLFSSKFDAKPLEKLLQSYFSNDENKKEVMLSEVIKDVLITSYNIITYTPYLFDSSNVKINNHEDFPLWQVARATSAAPTYFRAAHIKTHVLVDGGLYTNNPAHEAYLRARELYPEAKIFFILSLGTGSSEKTSKSKLEKGGKLAWAQNAHSITMNSAVQSTERALERLQKLDNHLNINYKRIQFKLPDDNMAMDNAEAKNISFLLAKAINRSHESDIEEITEFLLKHIQKFNYFANNKYRWLQSVIDISKDIIDVSDREFDLEGLRILFNGIKNRDEVNLINLANTNLGKLTNCNDIGVIIDFFKNNKNCSVKRLNLSKNILNEQHVNFIIKSFPKDDTPCLLDTLILKNTSIDLNSLFQLGTYCQQNKLFKIEIDKSQAEDILKLYSKMIKNINDLPNIIFSSENKIASSKQKKSSSRQKKKY